MQRLHLQEPIQLDNLRASQMLSQIRLESLPKMNLLVQSDTTSILVRQLTCLLNVRNNYTKSDTTMHTLLLSQKANTHKTPEAEDNYLAYTEYQSHWVLWPIETQSPGSSAAACSPPRGANCPKCLYLVSTNCQHLIS